MAEGVETEWIEAMRAGDFRRAWEINHRDLARRIAAGEPKHQGPRHLQHIWQGEPLNDARVLVRCYHGLGDTLQFIRFAELLRRLAREVIVWVQPELLDVIAGAKGVDRVLPLHDGTPEVACDADIEMMELAFALRVSRGQIECTVPYIASPRDDAFGRQVLRDPDTFKIGLIWRAGDWDERRSIALRQFAALSELPCVQVYLLQPPTNGDEAKSINTKPLWHDRISDVAATIANLDLILTVDTMMAHLAGAMALPVWTLLCRDCDWRWGTCETTPWYPSMRLFRQACAGDWTAPVEHVSRALARIVRERTKERYLPREVEKQKNLRLAP